jgi:type IV pilus assembly protein PilE
LPSYFGSVRKSRRAEAVSAVTQIQQGQERWRANNAQYTSVLSDVGVTTPTSKGYYALTTSPLTGSQTCPNSTTVTCAAGTCYSVTATAVAGTSQANDTGCTVLTASWLGPCGTLSTTPTKCWSK